MTTGGGEAAFIDTNVLVYAGVVEAPLQAYDIRHLLTHNTANFSRLTHLITVIPLSDNL